LQTVDRRAGFANPARIGDGSRAFSKVHGETDDSELFVAAGAMRLAAEKAEAPNDKRG
jgi:hypothetical protein